MEKKKMNLLIGCGFGCLVLFTGVFIFLNSNHKSDNSDEKISVKDEDNIIDINMFKNCNYQFIGFDENARIEHSCSYENDKNLSSEQKTILSNITYTFSKSDHLKNDDVINVSLEYDKDILKQNNLNINKDTDEITVKNLEKMYNKVSNIPTDVLTTLESNALKEATEEQTKMLENYVCTETVDRDCQIKSFELIDKILFSDEYNSADNSYSNKISFVYKLNGTTFRDTSQVVKNPGITIDRDIYFAVEIINFFESTNVDNVEYKIQFIRRVDDSDRGIYRQENILRDYRKGDLNALESFNYDNYEEF